MGWADDARYARLKELEVREETLKLVAGLVGLDKVRSQMRMISLRREFLQERDKARVGMSTSFFFSCRSQLTELGTWG